MFCVCVRVRVPGCCPAPPTQHPRSSRWLHTAARPTAYGVCHHPSMPLLCFLGLGTTATRIVVQRAAATLCPASSCTHPGTGVVCSGSHRPLQCCPCRGVSCGGQLGLCMTSAALQEGGLPAPVGRSCGCRVPGRVDAQRGRAEDRRHRSVCRGAPPALGSSHSAVSFLGVVAAATCPGAVRADALQEPGAAERPVGVRWCRAERNAATSLDGLAS